MYGLERVMLNSYGSRLGSLLICFDGFKGLYNRNNRPHSWDLGLTGIRKKSKYFYDISMTFVVYVMAVFAED